MKIEFPLLSILSIGYLLCVLLLFGFQSDVELYSWEIEVSVSPDEIRVMVDPVFVVWSKCNMPFSLWIMRGKHALALGNVIVMREAERDEPLINFGLQHEYNHVLQQRVLGFLTPLGYLFLNMEGEPYYSTAPDIEKNSAAMWKPPLLWVDQWHFLAVCIDS